MTPEEKAQKDWDRSMRTLSREVACMRTRQQVLGAHTSTATITANMTVLDTCFEHMKEKFAELIDNYPEHEVDNNGEVLLTREKQNSSEWRVSTEIRSENCLSPERT